MGRFEDRRERAEAALATSEVSLRRAFERAVREARLQLGQEEVERLLANGRQDQILAVYGRELEHLLAAYQDALVDSGESLSSEIGAQVGGVGRLDLAQPRLVDALRTERRRILFDLVAAQRGALDAALRAAGPSDLSARARAARASLGISAAGVLALDRFARALRQRPSLSDEERERRGELEPPPAGTDDRTLAAYRRDLGTATAAGLALSLAQSATNRGAQAALEQAGVEGLLDTSDWMDRWRTRRDAKVRDQHRAMEGQERPHGVPFRSGAGNFLRFPGDPSAPASETANCRCVVTTSVGIPAGVA